MSEPSKYADEGTIAHALAAMCLRENKPASAYVGRLIVAEDYEHAQLSPSTAHRWMRCGGSHTLETRAKFKPRRFSHQVDQDMADFVQIYLDTLQGYVMQDAEVDMLIEHKLAIEHLTAEEGAFGTGDAIILDFTAAEIQAHDLKFGRGVPVSARRNEQLAMYLSSVLLAFGEFAPEGGWKTFRGVIHQPRIFEKPDEYVWTLEELREFEKECRAAAKRARDIKATFAGKPHLKIDGFLAVGDKQCKFCSAKATCPALAKAAQEICFAEFTDLDKTDVVPVAQAKKVQTAIPADMERLTKLWRLAPLAEEFFKAVNAEMEARILAGEKAPGVKVVQGKRGNRAWRDATEAEETLKAMRVKHDVMYEYSVISPTAAEKLVKSKVIGDRQWKKLQELITQAPGKPTVVEESDKRPALEIKPVVESFPVLEKEPK